MERRAIDDRRQLLERRRAILSREGVAEGGEDEVREAHRHLKEIEWALRAADEAQILRAAPVAAAKTGA